jgi:hypothetical protein
MNIQDSNQKINPGREKFSKGDHGELKNENHRFNPYFFARHGKNIYTAALIVLVGLGSFGLGRISAEHKYDHDTALVSQSARAAVGESEGPSLDLSPGGFYIGSNITFKYYFPWCLGAWNIPEGERVVFRNLEEAKRAQYVAAKGCKGLK